MSGADNDRAATSSTQPRENKRHRHRTQHKKDNDNANLPNVTDVVGQSSAEGRAQPIRNVAGRHRRPKQQQQTGQSQELDFQTIQTQSQEGASSQQSSSQEQQSQQQQPPNRESLRRKNRPRKGRDRRDTRKSRPDEATVSDHISNPNNLSVAGPGRVFGTGLTQPSCNSFQSQPSSGGQETLRADVPEFVPGQSLHTQGAAVAPVARSVSGKGKGRRSPRGGKSKASGECSAAATAAAFSSTITEKSSADDIATRIHEDIAHNLYECPVCTSEIGKRSK
ncbi:FKBP12-associated protein, partial [Ascosphaera aggregata]